MLTDENLDTCIAPAKEVNNKDSISKNAYTPDEESPKKTFIFFKEEFRAPDKRGY